jgi:hypothetical protein
MHTLDPEKVAAARRFAGIATGTLTPLDSYGVRT